MPAPKPTNPFIEVPINRGERPDWQQRINYPKLFNMFVGESGYVYTDPGLKKLSPNAPDSNTRAIHYSPYKGGRYFVVTEDKILEISKAGGYKEIATIKNSGRAVQIAENLQNQIGIVDGRKAYVYAQQTEGFTILGASQGFELEQPISIIVINTIAIVLDKKTGQWIISDVNNMLNWPALDYVAQIDPALTEPVGLSSIVGNLFIFGTTGIERWVPSTGNNPYLFPFTKDTSYRQDFGAIATNGIVQGFNSVYFLSSKYVPMVLTPQSITELGDADYKNGLAKILSEYTDVAKCESSFYAYKGVYTFSMTFRDTGICWRYCVDSQTYSRSDDLIISALRTYDVVATPDGVFTLEPVPQVSKLRQFVGDTIRIYKGQQPNRMSLNGFDVQIIQGLLNNDDESLELSFSLDGQQTWTNIVNRPMGKTGERNAQTTWVMNITGKEFTPRVSYYGPLDFTIRQMNAIVN